MIMANNKLKQAVSLALALFALSAQQQALALGLGDIEVKSHLGQALKAKIKIYGAADLKQSELESNTCFKLNTGVEELNEITRANFALSSIIGDEATLSVTTPQIINEPIAHLSVVTECGGNIRRDYVLLIDPDLGAEPVAELEEVAVATANVKSTEAKKPAKMHPQLAEASAETSVKKSKRERKLHKNNEVANNNPNIVLHVPGGKAQASISSAAKTELITDNKPSQAHLSVSKGTASNTYLSAANLQLDKQLSFNAGPNAQPIVAEVEMQDDLAAMQHRFINLEKQIAKLQQQNLVLASDNQFKTQQITETESIKDKFKWMGYALGVILVLVSGQIATQWWRRRLPKQIGAGANWMMLDVTEGDDEMRAATSKQHAQNTGKIANAPANDADLLGPSLFEQHMVVEETSFDATVLDHADVFLSHGRTSMAIQLLQNHLLDHPKQSVTIWLFLLDLLTKENMQAAYEQTALECKEHFNIKISAFAADANPSYVTFESFTRLAEGLQQVWGTPAALAYLDDLIYNNRLEPRAGLDKNLIDELLLLKAIAHQNLNTAEVIQLDDKKLAMKEQKEALLAAKAAEKKQQLAEKQLQAQGSIEASEKFYEFNLVEWK